MKSSRIVTVAVFASLPLLGCGSPTAPDTRTGMIFVRVRCDGAGASPLVCRAETYCGTYRCPNPVADGADVTNAASWSVADDVIRQVGPGRFEAVRPGDSVIRVAVPGAMTEARQTVSVFPGTAPLPTHEIFGSVRELGKTDLTGGISGALIQVLDGLIAGRTATTGVPPELPPGFVGPFGGPNSYRILAVPPGTYRVRATARGYLTDERLVTVRADSSAAADFELRPE